jgi:hypothetical protein
MDLALREPVYYFLFTVLNSGKSRARLCEAFLETLWQYDASDRPVMIDSFRPMHLPLEENINPNREVYCALGLISSAKYQRHVESSKFVDVPGAASKGLRFLLAITQYPNAQPNCLVKGKYAVRVSVYSENAKRHDAYFQINWTGNWQDKEEDMFREIVIKEIPRIAN